MSTGSNDSLYVPAINSKKYFGATDLRYIQIGRANQVQDNEEWNLEETIRHIEQKFSKDTAIETTNDEKLLKTKVSRQTLNQIPKENRPNIKNLST